MAVNKVVYGTTLLVDLTNDTVTSDNLENGYTAHDKSGELIVGTLELATVYKGTSEPSPDLGNDGDYYFKLRA